MNDIDRHDANDNQLDRNLLAAARHLDLPAEPSPLQRARWKQAPKKGILGMKRENFWRVLGAGGALAACVTLAVVFGLGGTKSVNAAMIFDSLRDAIRKSLWIELDNVSDEGITANGRVLLVFKDDESPAGNLPGSVDDDVAASYVELHVTAADDHEDLAGLDLEAVVGMAPGNQWAFLQTHHIPANLFAEAPMLAFFAPALNQGILLDLAQLDASNASTQSVGTGPGGGPVAKFSFSTGGNEGSSDNDEESETQNVLEFSFSTNHGADADDNANGSTADDVNDHLHGLMFGSDFHASADTPEAEAAIEAHMQMVKDFLTGRFTPEQMTQFIDMIEASADSTTVTPNADGSFLLRASGFDFGGHADVDEDLVLEIEYRENGGIDSVKLLNIGDGAGQLRFVFSDEDANADVLDRSRFSSREGVRTINGLGDLFGGGQ
ncbi:MAG: hypothetical protein H6819_13105 [Phycisphaerales bacterium]|nr:hypothetical protein [Phycisphaerales bacterium]MCB9855771.1 hypothetical protein [Phycisphaerales bacterium]MCB9862666.1 hypothetical protein [Phycisphaerales bacterium]